MLFEKNNFSLGPICRLIKQACQKVGRSEDAVTLLAVSKNQPLAAILSLLASGQRWFGESRVQEALSKWPNLRQEFPDLRLHLIGPLQTNKINKALILFDIIETVDRPQLVLAMAKAWKNKARICSKILIQVNTGREPQKGGVMLKDLPALINLCRLHHLPLTGLMCIPPVQKDPTSHFMLLAKLAKMHHLPDLSMGMSNDYPTAIAHGATWVRLGTVLWTPATRP